MSKVLSGNPERNDKDMKDHIGKSNKMVCNETTAWAIIEKSTGRIIMALGADSLAVYKYKHHAYNESPNPYCMIRKVKIVRIKEEIFGKKKSNHS